MRLAWLALAWCAGIAFAAHDLISAGLWGISVFLALLFSIIVTKSRRGILIICAVFCIGGLRFALYPASADVAQYIGVGGMTLEGVIASAPFSRADRVLVRLQTESVTRIGTTNPTSGAV
ncbi:MAG: DUF4131 domain-containing protein, partial [Chloroflexota bacterium]|nr:DUF4131 domain-containing protein [Chloroflexota bacterium]